MLIEGSVALVTGSSRGLGRALTSSLIERGARRVYAGTRHLDDGMVQDSVPIRLDVTSKCEIEESVQTCSDVNLIFNNAVEARFSSLLSSEAVPDARAQMETNYFGPLAICQSFAPVLARNGGGAIVNICSIVSFFNAPTMASFCPTKAALWSMTNGLRMELRSQGTLVVAVHSGFIDTDLSAGLEVPKHKPKYMASLILDAVEAEQEQLLADERTKAMKAALPRDLELIYPDVERRWLEQSHGG